MNNKIIRTICYFKKDSLVDILPRVKVIAEKLEKAGYDIQTNRICSPSIDELYKLDASGDYSGYLFGAGTLTEKDIEANFDKLINSNNISFHLDLTKENISEKSVGLLFNLISRNSSKTFNFSYVYNNPPSTPFFPSGTYAQDGFAIGLQPTDLSADCSSLGEWFGEMKKSWEEIIQILGDEKDLLGIDSSIAPLFHGKSSLMNFIKRLGYSFEKSATSDSYIQMTSFIKNNNPKPIGLCGLMLPCLEDFELAEEYENGRFSIERNIFLSLHSGLGIDTYPIGINEDPQRVMEIIKLVQKLSNKYSKPLSVRFVSDGRAKIGQQTDFKNKYLKDVTVKGL